MISALIFSMNRVGDVIKTSEKLRDYLDEIIVIDSSEKEKFNLLKNEIPYAKVYWLPPLGMADLYYKIGLQLSSNDWILHLDDDEEPNEELLKDLKGIIKDKNVYSICRFDTKGEFQRLFRLFHRDNIIPTGLIHFTWASNVKAVELNEKYGIIHYEKDIDLNKLKRYAIFESWQFGYKIFSSVFNQHYKSMNPNKTIKDYKRIFYSQTMFGKFGWFLMAMEYNIYILFEGIKSSRNIKSIFQSFYYAFFIQLNIFKDFHKKYEVWMKIIEKDVFEFLGLDNYENALKSLSDMNSANGVENFIRLVENKRKEIL